jgi:hypothetical protein
MPLTLVDEVRVLIDGLKYEIYISTTGSATRKAYINAWPANFGLIGSSCYQLHVAEEGSTLDF